MLRSEQRISFLLGIILFFYFYPFLFPTVDESLAPISLYIIPSFWLVLTIYVRSLNKVTFKAKRRFVSNIILWVFITAFIYLLVFFAAGIMDGFGKNPYDTRPVGIIKNVFIYGSVLVLKEFVRHYLINSIPKRRIILYGTLIVLVYSVIDVNMVHFLSLKVTEDIVSFAISKFMVVIALNIFLTNIAYLSGYIPCIIFVFLLKLPLWTLEVIPNLTWLSTAVIGLIIPVLGLSIINDNYKKLSKKVKKVHYKKQNLYGWVITGFISVCIVWFVVGVFPIAPTVIITGSMEPAIYPGDVSIIRKINRSDVVEGDVVQYWTGDYFIIHRVIDIYEENGTTYYVTKGDNNPSKDSKPVEMEQIKGILMYTIPKIGKPALLLKSKSDEDINEQIMTSND
ncbi:signal peptidase I [Mycoplasmatota bacterium zrk1]